MAPRDTVTKLLAVSREGDPHALNQLMSLLYEELHTRAVACMKRERAGHTLQPTALVHEAYLRLVDQDRVRWKDRQHFLAIAATMMRRILVNHARDRAAAKRGGGLERVTLDEGETPAGEHGVDLLALDEALEDLAASSERLSRIVELRFFGGMSTEEISGVLGVDPRTVKRGWRAAKAILFAKLGKGTRNDRTSQEADRGDPRGVSRP